MKVLNERRRTNSAVSGMSIVSLILVVTLSTFLVEMATAKPSSLPFLSASDSTATKSTAKSHPTPAATPATVAVPLAMGQVTTFFKKFLDAFFFDGFGVTSGSARSQLSTLTSTSASASSSSEDPYDSRDNDLFNFIPRPEIVLMTSYDPGEPDLDPGLLQFPFIPPAPAPRPTPPALPRKLTPVDLSKPFIFDDADEVEAANSTTSEIYPPMKKIEFLDYVPHQEEEEERSTLKRPSTFAVGGHPEKSEASTKAPGSTPKSSPTMFDLPKAKVQSGSGAAAIHGLTSKPTPKVATKFQIPIISKREAPEQPPPSPERSMIFPDDPEYTGFGDSSESPKSECSAHQALYNSKCEALFFQGPCGAGEHLVEDQETGQGKCRKTECRYPETVELDGGKSGECVAWKYHVCPEGMRLSMSRSGLAECDCRPGFLYSTKDSLCYEAYHKGPCRNSEYFVLHQSSGGAGARGRNAGRQNSQGQTNSRPAPKCVRNPCRKQGPGFVCTNQTCPMVRGGKQENCQKLNGPCDKEGRTGILVVSQETLELHCRTSGTESDAEQILPGEIETRILGQVPELTCAPGTKMDITGKCRKTVRFNRNGK